MVAPAANACPLPDERALERGSLVEPLTVGEHAGTPLRVFGFRRARCWCLGGGARSASAPPWPRHRRGADVTVLLERSRHAARWPRAAGAGRGRAGGGRGARQRLRLALDCVARRGDDRRRRRRRRPQRHRRARRDPWASSRSRRARGLRARPGSSAPSAISHEDFVDVASWVAARRGRPHAGDRAAGRLRRRDRRFRGLRRRLAGPVRTLFQPGAVNFELPEDVPRPRRGGQRVPRRAPGAARAGVPAQRQRPWPLRPRLQAGGARARAVGDRRRRRARRPRPRPARRLRGPRGAQQAPDDVRGRRRARASPVPLRAAPVGPLLRRDRQRRAPQRVRVHRAAPARTSARSRRGRCATARTG